MLERFRAWPKAELHLHLEGSVEPETMRELVPGLSPEEAGAMYRCTDFRGFLQCFKWVVEQLRTPEAYGLITRRLLERLAAENVRYAEITIAAGVVLWKNQEFGPVYDAIREAARGSEVEAAFILDAVRHFGTEHAMQVAGLAAERAGDGVVAFGIGGDETRGPAEWFGGVFEYARAAGLHLVAHAGEAAGPESVWAALRIGAERIGHGIRSAEDPDLLAHLRDNGIPLEVCITSNYATGVVPNRSEHPVRRLFDSGAPITLNTDDPGVFGCTLSGEYARAADEYGFSEAELRSVADNAFRFRFRR